MNRDLVFRLGRRSCLLGFPAVIIGIGLSLWPHGLSLGVSMWSRAFAIIWCVAAGGAAAWLSICREEVDGEGEGHPSSQLLSSALIAAVFYFLWVSFPDTPALRARLLFERRSATPDRAAFRTAVLELMRDGVDLEHEQLALLGMAIYRDRRLDEPATGLYLQWAARRGLLIFAEPANILEKIRVGVGALESGSDLGGLHEALEGGLWRTNHKIHATPEAFLMPSGSDPVPVASVPASIGPGSIPPDKSSARQILTSLARSPEMVRSKEFHGTACRALLILGRHVEAAREWYIFRSMTGGSPEPEIEEKLIARSRELVERSRGLDRAHQLEEASASRVESWLVHPSPLEQLHLEFRNEVKAALELELEKARRALEGSDDQLASLLTGDEEHQLQRWKSAARLPDVSRGLWQLGEKSSAVLALQLIPPPLQDSYLRWIVSFMQKKEED